MRVALLSSDPSVVLGDGHSCPVRLRGLALALARAGHDLNFVCAAAEPESEDSLGGVPVRALRSPVSVREIDWHFSRINPDVVIERYVPGSLEGARAAREAGVPHVYDIDRALEWGGLATSAAVRGALPEALALSRGVIANNEFAAERLRALLGASFPVAVVPNAAGPEFLKAPAPDAVTRVEEQACLPEGGLRVGFFGALEPGCGLLPLIEAVGAIDPVRRPRVVVVGDGPERNAALRAADRVRAGLVLCGRVPHRDVAAHLALCQVVVASAEPDGGAPLSMLEAMAMQRAVLANATDAVRSVARDGHDACLVPAGDTETLAGTLSDLGEDAPRRARLGRNARETVRSRHTWDRRVNAVVEFLKDLRALPLQPAAGWDGQGLPRAISG